MPNAQQYDVSNPASPSTSNVPSRLEFIDGLRAICAIYVVMFHCVMAIEKFNSMPRWVRWIGRPFGFWGHQSVDVFIVLSGFCLMLPVAKSGELKLRNGFVSYLTKRAWRILPPYYAVLLICLVMTALLPALRQPGPSWRHALPAFEPGVIISHLLLIHNWSLDWFQKINPSLWSIAVEWQIYFVFPLLLWIFKRAGWLTGVFAGFAIGFSVFLFTTPRVAEVMFCWYVGLFALGMAAAHAVTAMSVTTSFGAKVPWLALAATVAISAHILTEKGAPAWLTDSIVGVATALLLVGCACQPIRDDRARSVALRILTWPPLVAIGHFSYSLYLIHNPILEIFDGWFVSRGLGYAPRMLGLMFLATPTCIALAWLFFQAFEKPFIRTSRSVPESTDTRIKLALQV